MGIKEILYQIRSNPINIWYTIQGYSLMYFHTFTNYYFAPIEKLDAKFKGAEECVDNGFCLECGCNIVPMLYSSKPCPKEEDKCYVG